MATTGSSFSPPNFSLCKTTPSGSPRYTRTRVQTQLPRFLSPAVAVTKLHATDTEKDVYGKDALAGFGWVGHVQPEGQKYYHNLIHHTVTDANLSDQRILAKITLWITRFESCAQANAVLLPSNYDLVLELSSHDEEGRYYISDYDSQTILYLDGVTTSDIGLVDVCSEDHLKLQLTYEYWGHVCNFPNHRELPARAQSLITNMLSHAWADNLTSLASTAPYSAEQCKDFLSNIEKYSNEPGQESYRTWIVARLLNEFLKARFINYYGETGGARLMKIQNMSGGSFYTEPSRLFNVISKLLFNQPKRELTEFHNVWIDGVILDRDWKAWNNQHLEEWRGAIFMGCFILLTSSVLTLKSHIQPTSLVVSVSQLGLATSQLFSLCAAGLAVTCILSHAKYRTGSATDTISYMTKHYNRTNSLEPLAIVLGLPFSFMLWSIVGLGIALVALGIETVGIATWTAIVTGVAPMSCLASIIYWAVSVITM
ncbi:hypothetical protein BU17DRAFT_65706 [Hysterangium stoloniferum]|nr:hypothetical protein BU17DRAFT_65706 [Hysterangium stoloniferum]